MAFGHDGPECNLPWIDLKYALILKHKTYT